MRHKRNSQVWPTSAPLPGNVNNKNNLTKRVGGLAIRDALRSNGDFFMLID
jgi:hypothetical protein